MNNFEKIEIIRNALSLKAKKFSLLVTISQPNYSQMKRGTRTAGDAIVNKICLELGIDKIWFKKWNGDINDPVIKQIQQRILPGKFPKTPQDILPPNLKCIPFVNKFDYHTYLNNFSDSTYLKQLPKMPFISDSGKETRYMVFEMRGDTMNNGTSESYLERDRIYGQEIEKELWCTSNFILRKHDYIIVHEEGIYIKRIIRHNTELNTITIHSLNDMYPDQVLNLRDVRQIFSIIESARRR